MSKSLDKAIYDASYFGRTAVPTGFQSLDNLKTYNLKKNDVAGCFGFISYVSGNVIFADYLLIPYIEGVGEVAVFCGAIIGASIGFLWFNAPPAKIFMGDTGSLALGSSLGAVGIITKHEIVLAITGGLFVLEAVSVMVQVVSFKLTGKRIFRMAPIHHHFEKKGWAESTVVIRFWIISIILAMIGLATLKLR